MKKIAVVGFGARAEGLLRNFNRFDMGVDLAGICDLNHEKAKKHVVDAGFLGDYPVFDNLDDLMQKTNPDGVFLSTNCETHANLAIQLMKYQKPLFLEKPVAISEKEVDLLNSASKSFKAQTLISFPLRVSNLCVLAKELIDSGVIGTVEQIQAVNNVTYGRVYYKSWYHDDKRTGGLFLQKATHDLDYICYLAGNAKASQICAMESKTVFKGNHKAGLVCENCDEYKTCPESTYVIKNVYLDDDPFGNGCSFACDTGNHDSASVIMMFNNETHAVYTQNFIARKGAARRGARLIGYKGTLEFDWITGDLNVYSHVSTRKATYHIDNNELFHYGGDKALCENFVEILNGGKSLAPLESGINSAALCLAAKRSAENGIFVNL